MLSEVLIPNRQLFPSFLIAENSYHGADSGFSMRSLFAGVGKEEEGMGKFRESSYNAPPLSTYLLLKSLAQHVTRMT